MQEILRYIQTVDGVIGCAIFSDTGNVIDSAFPSLIDRETLRLSALQNLELTNGLQISETFDLIDFRYNEGRLLIKRVAGASLFLLCAKTINVHLLATTLNLVAKKIETALAVDKVIVSKTATIEEPAGDPSVLTLRISHLANRDASASFDSLGMVAVSQPTSSYISDFYKLPFKKLTLTVPSSGKTGTFAAMVMKDMEPIFDGTIIVGPAIEKKLSINEGDKIEVRLS